MAEAQPPPRTAIEPPGFVLAEASALTEELKCCVCLDSDPVMHEPCQNMFCKSCYMEMAVKGLACPLCRKPLSDQPLPVPRFILNKLNAIPVLCSACNKRFERKAFLDDHRNTCESRAVACDAESLGCTWRGKCSERQAHAGGCVLCRIMPAIAALNARVSGLEAQLGSSHALVLSLQQEVAQLRRERPAATSPHVVESPPPAAARSQRAYSPSQAVPGAQAGYAHKGTQGFGGVGKGSYRWTCCGLCKNCGASGCTRP
eukprot:m51a1_g3352 hypothetical protein (259) ;mRNA; r:413512-414531